MPSRHLNWIPQATVFVSSFCVMVIELVAGRVVARHLGSSLYTWTSVIGIVLAGIAVGNWIGGRLADRYPARPALATLFLGSALTCVFLMVANHTIGGWTFLWSLAWPLRVGTHVAIVFLLPSLVLGMISPVAAKMALDQGHETGRTIGSVYAWGVVGSIVGTFATGFWLIAAFGTAAVVWSVALVLAAVGIFFGAATRLSWFAGVLVLATATIGAAPWAWAESLGTALALRESFGDDVLWVRESQYSHIRIHQLSQQPDIRNMHLDKLIHSSIDMADPTDLKYPYARVYGVITDRLVAGRDSLNTLTIGGGGYVFPRYLELRWPRSRTEVVEVDPAVTEAALAAFGLPVDHGLEIEHADGRAFLGQRVHDPRGNPRYDVVYFDAVNDYSVPYQLTTVECMSHVEEVLAPDGTLLMTLIDIYSEGGFLGAMVATLEAVFPHVAVVTEGSPVSRDPDVRRTFILVAWKGDLDLRGIERDYRYDYPLYRLTPADLAELRDRTGGRVLTDDWAPVENLLAPVVRRSSDDFAAGLYVARAQRALRERDLARALRETQRALERSPKELGALRIAAFVSLAQKDWAAAADYNRAILALRPSETKARVDLAAALAESGRTADAITLLEETVRMDPRSIVAWRNLGVLRLRRDDGAGAVAAFSQAVELDPGNPDRQAELASVLARVGETERAAALYRRILSTHPKHGAARRGLAELGDGSGP